MTTSSLRPGASLGVYPQRRPTPESSLERLGKQWLQGARVRISRQYKLQRVVSRIDRAASGLDELDNAGLAQCRAQVRYALQRDGLTALPVLRVFALIREYAQRSLGKRHYDVQLFGAWAIVNGNMAEMATGEGKSLTATLAAATAALAGIPVHVVTTNEYLAGRDAQEMRPLYEALDLSVAAIEQAMTPDEKQAAYQCDIVYCTNQQVAFDYLRDRLIARNESGPLALKFGPANRARQLVLRGLCFAIVDEADSVLVDEARTPLILSRELEDTAQEEIVEQALDLARTLTAGQHFYIDERERSIQLSVEGQDSLDEQTSQLAGIWAGQRHARFLVHQALCALHLYERDLHYLVRNEKIEIIDSNTGRTMADRSWQRGLHQMIECKEQCVMTGYRETLASISYQRFFGRYLRLGGMSGTLKQTAGELRSVYGQRVIAVPTHRPCLRDDLGVVVYRRSADKWQAVVARVLAIHSTGRPILVGTGSVQDSEQLAGLLFAQDMNPRVLNARQDQHEAQIVAAAGQFGQITIATGMAGRGTDIALGPGVAALGGLHVIITESHQEYRVDRQLQGRSARQGDPGSSEALLCLNDSLFRQFYSRRMRRLLGWYLRNDKPLGRAPSRCLVSWAQLQASRQLRAERRMVLQMDQKLGKLLAYTGRGD